MRFRMFHKPRTSQSVREDAVHFFTSMAGANDGPGGWPANRFASITLMPIEKCANPAIAGFPTEEMQRQHKGDAGRGVSPTILGSRSVMILSPSSACHRSSPAGSGPVLNDRRGGRPGCAMPAANLLATCGVVTAAKLSAEMGLSYTSATSGETVARWHLIASAFR
jgi:hypothetical protein